MQQRVRKTAFRGVESRPIDCRSLGGATFDKALGNTAHSPERKFARAVAVATLQQQTRPLEFDGDARAFYPVSSRAQSKSLPRHVASAAFRILDVCVPNRLTNESSGEVCSFTSVYSFLRGLARSGFRFPAESASGFYRRLSSDYLGLVHETTFATLAPPNAVEFAEYRDQVNYLALFSPSKDALKRWNIDELDRVVRDSNSGRSQSELDGWKSAFITLLKLAPSRARDALGARLEQKNLPASIRLLLADLARYFDSSFAPLFRTLLANGVDFERYIAGQVLARMRDPDYQSKLVAHATSLMRRDGTIHAIRTRCTDVLPLGFHLGTVCYERIKTPELASAVAYLIILFGRIPLQVWEEYFQDSPEGIVDKIASSGFFPALLTAFREAYCSFGGSNAWLAALSRPPSDAADPAAEAAWRSKALDCAVLQGVDATRKAIDCLRTVESGENSLPPSLDVPLLATQLALYEPYPWRDEFANYFDSTVWSTLRRFGCEESKSAKPAPVRAGRYSFVNCLESDEIARQKERRVFENVSAANDWVTPISVMFKAYVNPTPVNATGDFANLFWNNVALVLPLVPRRLREKYMAFGRRFHKLCVQPFLDNMYSDYTISRTAVNNKLQLLNYSRKLFAPDSTLEDDFATVDEFLTSGCV